MKWILIVTTVLFYVDLLLLYKMYNLIILPLLIGGTLTIVIIFLAMMIFKEKI